jgi:hypothetical protein
MDEKEIEEKIDALNDQLRKMDEEDHPDDNTLDGYMDRRNPIHEKIYNLDRQRRMIAIPEYEELPSYGDVMQLTDFIQHVNGKTTKILIHPRDVERNTIRKDFDTIIWFNK